MIQSQFYSRQVVSNYRILEKPVGVGRGVFGANYSVPQADHRRYGNVIRNHLAEKFTPGLPTSPGSQAAGNPLEGNVACLSGMLIKRRRQHELDEVERGIS